MLYARYEAHNHMSYINKAFLNDLKATVKKKAVLDLDKRKELFIYA